LSQNIEDVYVERKLPLGRSGESEVITKRMEDS
jgi:hypothetical protein